jgi:hypothetical protein
VGHTLDPDHVVRVYAPRLDAQGHGPLTEQVQGGRALEKGRGGLVVVVYQVAAEEVLLDGDVVGVFLEGPAKELLVARRGANVPATLVYLDVDRGITTRGTRIAVASIEILIAMGRGPAN